ncbi:hypothetical protein [Streptodolium elevatio]|uniref:Uncharacterized protein n=1 Tax=Streptodolium elevatio TaxID=3157996 RepID=A0ABV3D8E2_9ACTN
MNAARPQENAAALPRHSSAAVPPENARTGTGGRDPHTFAAPVAGPVAGPVAVAEVAA